MDLVSLPMIFSVMRSLKNGNLSEAAEQELFVTGLLEPGSGPRVAAFKATQRPEQSIYGVI
jgi:hypothetical protein